jgi:hypothetical protein
MASTYLSRTFGSGNRRTFTISTWLKISNVSTTSQNEIFSRRIDSNNQFRFSLYQGKFYVLDQQSNVNNINFMSNALRRDCNGFYHVVLKIDTTQATSTERVKIYVNGNLQTSYSTETYPSQNYDTYVNQNAEHRIGEWNSTYFDGSMAHFHFIDGTAYDADTFGETDATTGIWKPKTAPSVTYGTNGFFLKFENSGAFGTDSSGNGNNFTVNGTMTQTIDTPSNVFATMNVLDSQGTYSNGNLKVQTADSGRGSQVSTLGVSQGKWYAEFKLIATSSSLAYIGIDTTGSTQDALGYVGKKAYGYAYFSDGRKVNDRNFTSYGDSYTTGDIIGVALNLDDNELVFYKNGTAQNSGTAISITASSSTDTGFYFFAFSDNEETTGNVTIAANFGNGFFGTTAVSSAQNPDDGIGIFEYSVPTGYKALCTKSINAQEYD